MKLSQPEFLGNELEYISKAIASKEMGPRGFYINAFQSALSNYIGVKNTLLLSSGTAAIHLGLQVLGVSKGDVVLCSTFTFAASAFPITYLGAEPVFVDAEMNTWNMCPVLLEKAIKEEIKLGKKPKAIIVVHTYGMPADMHRICEIAKSYKIPVLEDAAAALGSKIGDSLCGSFGDIAIFSFNANKIISTGGGGVLVSKHKKYIEKASYLSSQAKENTDFYLHKQVGFNYSMSNITAAIGLAQLEGLEKKCEVKRNIYRNYRAFLKLSESIEFQTEQNDSSSNRWLSCFLLNSEASVDKIRWSGLELGIEFGRLWNPLHCQPVFASSRVYSNGNAEMLFNHGIALPSSESLKLVEQEQMAKLVLGEIG